MVNNGNRVRKIKLETINNEWLGYTKYKNLKQIRTKEEKSTDSRELSYSRTRFQRVPKSNTVVQNH